MLSTTPLDVRIVHFLESTGEGGDALAALALARGQLQLGHRAQIAICHGAKSAAFCERARADGVEATDLETVPVGGPAFFLSRVRNVRATLARLEPDVVHTHTGTLASRTAHLVGARLVRGGVRVLTAHWPFPWPPESGRARVRWQLASHLLDHVITPSELARKEQLRARIAATRVTSLPNAVDMDRHARGERAATRARLGFAPDDRVILFLARLEQQKRPLDALAVFREAAKRVPSLRMLMVGAGGLDGSCRRFIAESGLGAAVVMTGFRTDVPDLMRASDVYLLPTEAESFGLTIVEAMAAGVPVVTSRISPLIDEVVPRDCALFADVGDVQGFANAVVSLIGFEDRSRSLANRARGEAAKRYSLSIVAQRHIDLYRRLAN